jgi:uncharacterized membrane protein YphA (DoxX/SURF4 family)
MKYAVLVARIILGLWFVYNGASYWVPALHMPMGHKPVAIELMTALVNSQMMTPVKLTELIVGLMLLTDLYVPLALVVSFPVTLMVAYVCLVVEWPGARPMIGGGATLLVHVFLLFAYLDAYKPMLVMKAKPFGGGG